MGYFEDGKSRRENTHNAQSNEVSSKVSSAKNMIEGFQNLDEEVKEVTKTKITPERKPSQSAISS